MDTAFVKSLKPEGEYMIKRRKALGKTLEYIKISCLGMAFQKIANCKNLGKYGIKRSYTTIPNIEPGENIIENGLANRKGCRRAESKTIRSTSVPVRYRKCFSLTTTAPSSSTKKSMITAESMSQ